MKIRHNLLITLAATVAATGLLTGCGTTSGYQQADKTGAGIAEFRDEIVKGKAAVDATMKSMGDVASTATSNPRPAFEKFSKDLANLDSTATKIKKRAADMQAQGQAYFKQWEEQMAQVQNPDIRKLAEERKAKLQATFQSIKTFTEPLKAQFDPWMSDLKDLQKYLAQDLTIAGVDAAKKLFTDATTKGFEVQKSLDGLVGELNTIAATLTPAKVETKK
jgi:hypothetical protein